MKLVLTLLFVLLSCQDPSDTSNLDSIRFKNTLTQESAIGPALPSDPAFAKTPLYKDFKKYSAIEVDLTATSLDQKKLLLQDIVDLNTNIRSEYKEKKSNQLFEKIFGGFENVNVSNFIEERIHYIMNDDNFMYQTSQWTVRFSKWLEGSSVHADVKGETLASNAGTLLWLISLVEQRNFSLEINGNKVLSNSSRNGVVILGSGYKKMASRFTLPFEYRISVLVHEARHSDCNGGIHESDLNFLRRATNGSDFQKNYINKSCGHLHSTCPVGHDYEGISACDSTLWGAYSVGAIYADVMAQDYKAKNDWVNYSIMKILAADNYGRLLYSMGKLENSLPDLTSKGYSVR